MMALLSVSVGFVIPAASVQEDLFAVKGTVVDLSGVVIQQAEVVFKGDSGKIVAHTVTVGSVNVQLPAGKYVVTISASGFVTAKLVDFSVPPQTAGAFHVILKVGPTDFGSGSPNVIPLVVPTVPSELPDINEEQTRTSLPVVQPAAPKRRSMRCLYRWRCRNAAL